MVQGKHAVPRHDIPLAGRPCKHGVRILSGIAGGIHLQEEGWEAGHGGHNRVIIITITITITITINITITITITMPCCCYFLFFQNLQEASI